VLVDPTQEEFIQWNQARETQHQERHDAEWRDIQASLTKAHKSPLPLGIPVVSLPPWHPASFLASSPKNKKPTFRSSGPCG